MTSKMTSKMTSNTSLPMTYKCGNCYINAYINRLQCYKDKNLKLVMGSLGINGWFEYGGKNWTKADFQKKINGFISDSHCWLEDADGNVYDFLYEDYNDWVEYRTKKPMKRVGLLEGVSKEELARDGVEYVPAPKDAQTALFLATFQHMKDAYEGLLSGRMSWCGTMLSQQMFGIEDLFRAFKNKDKYAGVAVM